MSFSREIKEELSKHIPTGRHCQIAEIAAIISLCGKISVNEKEQHFIKIVTENLTVARKYFMLIKEAFQGDIQIQVRRNRYLKRSNSYALIIKDSQMSMRILKWACPRATGISKTTAPPSATSPNMASR